MVLRENVRGIWARLAVAAVSASPEERPYWHQRRPRRRAILDGGETVVTILERSSQRIECLSQDERPSLSSAPKREVARWWRAIHAQIEEIIRKDASNGKPFWEVRLRDAGDSMILKAWSDSPNFSTCEGLARGMAVAIDGEFCVGIFGLDAKRWSVLALPENEAQELFQGDETERAAAQAEFDLIRRKSTVSRIRGCAR